MANLAIISHPSLGSYRQLGFSSQRSVTSPFHSSNCNPSEFPSAKKTSLSVVRATERTAIRAISGGGGVNEGGSDDRKKKGMSMSQKLTLGYAALVGIGGVAGYLVSGSQKSLAAGGISALVLFYVYTALPSKPVLASSLGLGVSAALLTVMGSRFMHSGKVFPAGVVALVSLIMTGGYFHGILRSLH